MSYLCEAGIEVSGVAEDLLEFVKDNLKVIDGRLEILSDLGERLPFSKYGWDTVAKFDGTSIAFTFGLKYDPTPDWIKGYGDKYPQLSFEAWKTSEADWDRY